MITRDADPRFLDNIAEDGTEGYREDGVDVMLDRDAIERVHVWDPGVREADGQTIRLLHDIAAIRPDPPRTVTAGGLHLPELALDPDHNTGHIVHASEQWHTGVCLARGPGVREPKRGRRVAMDFEPGDRVVYHRASGRGVRWHDGKMAVLVKAGGNATEGDAVAAVVLADGSK